MILTITLNPSIDNLYFVDHFSLGNANFTTTPLVMPGGKGVNCARALKYLKEDVTALLAVGGFTGDFILSNLKQEDINTFPINIAGISRNAITIMHDNSIHTEIIENGPFINSEEEKQIFKKIISYIKENTQIKIITINGSVHSQNNRFYADLIAEIRRNFGDKVKILADVSKDQLKSILDPQNTYFPDFIKPNFRELSEVIHVPLESKLEAANYLLQASLPVKTVMVSCGSEGALVKHDNDVYDVTIPVIQVVNPTGSGDSTVAGTASGMLDDSNSIEYVIKKAMACGILNTMEKGVGVVDSKQVDYYMSQISIEKLS